VPQYRRVLECRHRHDHAHGRRVHARLSLCSVDTGNPHGWLDTEEPQNAARTVELMKLKYVVLPR